MTFLVKTYYNTDENGDPVPDEVAMEDMPITYHGPFDDLTAAISWMENDYPDGDTDVYEQIADDFDIPADADYINTPESIHGDNPDQEGPLYIVWMDLAPGSQELQGS
jgi:hypothetical protein